ncbi:flagellar filament capping protein FliD [Massilia sp. CFBP9012]|uniref:flagellar filament capping protein FliD n=1 Tax=Massilia sp. CFBP9012 TaxID=3096531 RepID=UPI002A6AC693|nr:flagellar filament capping protein FliD [Massilia sp. CFBP9012]MDY0974731.1 flagellar filament capping protein FliD [Massilia sp. CFBP9012]
MATAISAPTYDPIPTANDLADKYIASRQAILTAQKSAANATEKGLADLSSALSAFQASLASLTGLNKTMYAQSAVFGDTTLGSASATSTAAAGTYSFFVKQLAAPSQVSYTGLTDSTGVGGKLTVNMGGAAAFEVDMASADADGNGTLTPREIAAAINAAANNGGKVTASIVNTNGTSELVLTSKETGANTALTLDTSLLTGTSSLAAANADPARRRVLSLAQDAEIRVGSETGTVITQATNTFTAIDGVKMTFTKAQASGEAPVTLTVGPDDKATTANVQAFVDAFNKLRTTLTKLTSGNDPATKADDGAFARDGGVRALNDRLTALLRPGSGDSLATFGIIANRSGTLELNADRLLAQLARNPNGLDAVIGVASASNPTGVAGELDKYLKSWSNGVDGQIKQRREQNGSLQTRLTDKQSLLDQQHRAAYDRYLKQFTDLQTMQGVMNYNVSLFDALFGNDKD